MGLTIQPQRIEGFFHETAPISIIRVSYLLNPGRRMLSGIFEVIVVSKSTHRPLGII